MKKLVAVETFENKAGFEAEYNVGTGMADMLTDALIQSGRFNVMERQAVQSIIGEQDFSAGDRTSESGSSAQIGKIIPVQILIRGSITEFDVKESGGGQGLSLYGVSVNMDKSTAHVAVIIRLIDTTTGRVIDSQRVEGQAEEGGMSLGLSISDIGIDQNSFHKTPLGKAVQVAVDNAVEYIVGRMDCIPWEGKVVTVKDNLVVINSGSRVGIQTDDVFEIYRNEEEFIDPDTGLSLGTEQKLIGKVKVVCVQKKFCKAEPLSGEGFKAKDIVKAVTE